MTLTTKILGASAAIWLAAMAVGGAAVVTPFPADDVEPIRYDADGKLLRPGVPRVGLPGRRARHDLRVAGREPPSRTTTCSPTCS